jgi:ABC-type bacteriocin/lantibiotic exporter with double-glycine peptidase domain
MILASHGVETTEDELVGQADVQHEGVAFEEVARLAQRYRLRNSIEQLDLVRLARLLEQGGLAIAFIDRGVLDGVFAIHAVVPIRVSPRYVTFLDPLRGERRVARRRFDAAWGNIQHLCLVCEPG